MYVEKSEETKNKPLWMWKSEDVTNEEYASFYKNLPNDWEDRLFERDFSVEQKRDNIKVCAPHVHHG